MANIAVVMVDGVADWEIGVVLPAAREWFGDQVAIASSDQMAMATLTLAKQRGLGVPDDLSIVSFDDTPIVRFAQPPLTAVTQPIAEVAARAVERIIAEQRDTLPPAAPVSVAATLNLRGSTAVPRRVAE